MVRRQGSRAAVSATGATGAAPGTPVQGSGPSSSFGDGVDGMALVRDGSSRLAVPVPGGGVAAPETPSVGSPAKGKKRTHAKIDLDDKISEAMAKVKEAKANFKKAQLETRNERRKKTRIVKKAAQLSCEDLERIAVLKRVGLWNPALAGFPLSGLLSKSYPQRQEPSKLHRQQTRFLSQLLPPKSSPSLLMQTVQTSKSPEPRAACISCPSRLRPVAAVVFSVDLFQCLICTHHVRLHGFVCAMKFSSKTE